MRARSFTDVMHGAVKPALIILIASTFLRGLLGVIILSLASSISYAAWPLIWRLSIEIIVFVGVFLTSEILFFNAISNVESARQTIAAIIDEEPAGKIARDQVAVGRYERRRQERIVVARQQFAVERAARNGFGALGVIYALNFIVVTAIRLPMDISQYVQIGIESLSVASGVFALWYYAARFREARENVADSARVSIEDAMLARLGAASERFKTGTESADDLHIASAALPGGHIMQRFVVALNRPPADNEVLDTNDVYQLLRATSDSERRRIREILRRLARDRSDLCWKDADKVGGHRLSWRIAGAAYVLIAREYGRGADAARTMTLTRPPSDVLHDAI